MQIDPKGNISYRQKIFRIGNLTVIKSYSHNQASISRAKHSHAHFFILSFMRRVNHWLISNDNFFTLCVALWFQPQLCESRFVCDILIGTLTSSALLEARHIHVQKRRKSHSFFSRTRLREEIKSWNLYIIFPPPLLNLTLGPRRRRLINLKRRIYNKMILSYLPATQTACYGKIW